MRRMRNHYEADVFARPIEIDGRKSGRFQIWKIH